MNIIKSKAVSSKYTDNKPTKKMYHIVLNDGYISPAYVYETACGKAFEMRSNTLLEITVIDC